MAMRVPLGLLLDTLIRRFEVMSLPFPFPLRHATLVLPFLELLWCSGSSYSS